MEVVVLENMMHSPNMFEDSQLHNVNTCFKETGQLNNVVYLYNNNILILTNYIEIVIYRSWLQLRTRRVKMMM